MRSCLPTYPTNPPLPSTLLRAARPEHPTFLSRSRLRLLAVIGTIVLVPWGCTATHVRQPTSPNAASHSARALARTLPAGRAKGFVAFEIVTPPTSRRIILFHDTRTITAARCCAQQNQSVGTHLPTVSYHGICFLTCLILDARSI